MGDWGRGRGRETEFPIDAALREEDMTLHQDKDLSFLVEHKPSTCEKMIENNAGFILMATMYFM